MATVNEFFISGSFLRGCNSSFISLIPKSSDPIGLNDFRPISLIGCYYKIISKMLADRIKRVIGKVIGEVQNAFIKGRFILDGILVANEVLDYVKRNRRKGMILKIDFEKAYDSVNWDYIQEVMSQRDLDRNGVNGLTRVFEHLQFRCW